MVALSKERMKIYGPLYFDWRTIVDDGLLDKFLDDNFPFTLTFSLAEVSAPRNTSDNYLGFPGAFCNNMEDEWTYYYLNNTMHIFFKSEEDKVKAILAK